MTGFMHNSGFQLHINGYYGKTAQADNLLIYGQVYHGDAVLSPLLLKAALVDAIDDNRLAEFIAGLNGFFSVVCLLEQQLLCFTDKTRSRPLFYLLQQNRIIIGDSATQLCSLYAATANINPVTLQEFQHTGFVTGNNTLHPNVKQLQAAELLSMNLNTLQWHAEQYYCFIPKNGTATDADLSVWQQSLAKVMQQVVGRLISYAAGRQIVLPLSGGYDSRALALYLKQADYTNVLCFTFGRAGSAEVELSRRVAKELGFNWHCVEYDRSLWRRLMQQTQFKDYLGFVHGLVSVPNVQVFPAIARLVEQKLVDADAVVAPGHTSAFFSGSLTDNGQAPPEQVVEPALQAVLARHYQNSRHPLDPAVIAKVRQQIVSINQLAQQQNISNYNSVAEAWNYRERQAKFIINSNRYYDFFQLDWWMPLWDSDFMAFWQRAPFNLRRRKVLWTSFVELAMTTYTGSTAPYGHASVKKYPWLTRCYSWFNYFLDDNHLYALVPFHRWLLFKLRFSKRSGTVFGNLAERCLNDYHKQFHSENRK